MPIIVPSSVLGANAPSNRITIGCIGMRNMGTTNMKGFMAKPTAQVVAVCDVDTVYREEARNIAGLEPKSAYNNFRELLVREDIDAVMVATPDHWHVPISIAAAKAGKDIYCEKPLTRTIAEGRTLCDTVKRYGRVLQTGSQQRSNNRFRFACELVRNGRIGKLHTIRVEIPQNSSKNPLTWQVGPVPEEFDYDMWLGPAMWRPYIEQGCHYNWHFIFDYGGGQLANWGPHYLDIAQWGNGTDHTGPVEIAGRGKFPKVGLFNTATRVDVEYTYANGVKLFCTTATDGHWDGSVKFEGSEGWVFIDRRQINAHPKSLLKSEIGPNEIRLYHSNDHHQNFLDCVRGRNNPVAPVEIGHCSATLCHLGNIAMLTGRKLKWDPDAERFVNNSEANRMLTRAMRSPWHL